MLSRICSGINSVFRANLLHRGLTYGQTRRCGEKTRGQNLRRPSGNLQRHQSLPGGVSCGFSPVGYSGFVEDAANVVDLRSGGADGGRVAAGIGGEREAERRGLEL